MKESYNHFVMVKMLLIRIEKDDCVKDGFLIFDLSLSLAIGDK